MGKLKNNGTDRLEPRASDRGRASHRPAMHGRRDGRSGAERARSRPARLSFVPDATDPDAPGHASRLRELVGLDLDESEARELLLGVTRHRRALRRRLGRDVGQHVALLDYILNLEHRLLEPKIIERTDLEAIERQAMVDSLTGLFNRHCFERALPRETGRSLRYGTDLSVLLLDLDGFKAVNDRRGHPIGDRVLRVVGARLREGVRTPDLPCRYGGDEFAVILPDTSLVEALRVVERVRASIASWFDRHTVGGWNLAITASAGVAATTSRRPMTAEELIGAADRALYRAKAAGGDRVTGSVERHRASSGRILVGRRFSPPLP